MGSRHRLIAAVLTIGAAAIILRMCVPHLWGPYLPPDVIRTITEVHTSCIGIDEVPIWPGDPRQAQCGSVEITVLAEGVPDVDSREPPVTKAICYRMDVEDPYWETIGQTRHEILTSTKTYFKVAVLQGGIWNVFPDEDVQDRSRWSEYRCPPPPED